MKKAVTKRKKPGPPKPRVSIGPAGVLAQSEVVSRAFGRALGFILIMTALLAIAGFSAATLFLLAKGVGRFLG